MFGVTPEQVFGVTPELTLRSKCLESLRSWSRYLESLRSVLSHSGAGVVFGVTPEQVFGVTPVLWSHSGTSGFSHPGAGVVI